MRAPIQSQKHYVQMSRSTVATVAVNTEDVIKVLNFGTAVDEVPEGAIVKAVYVELWVLNSGNDGSHVLIIGKNEASSFGATFAQMNALGTYDEKKNIFFTHQGLDPNDGTTGPQVVVRQWIPIPKTKQRFGKGDSLTLQLANNSLQDLFYCGFFTYKALT